MKLVVGLGNPGKEYEKTRHNVGFLTLDRLAEKIDLIFDKSKCKANYGIFKHNDERIVIAKPLTYMNSSGEAVSSLLKFYDIDVNNLIVIHDDLDLPLGKLRIRYQGSCGGQNGMRSIIDLLKTDKINRIRIGISNNKLMDTKDYVLSKFSKEELKTINDAIDKATDAIIYSFDHNFEEVMSNFN